MRSTTADFVSPEQVFPSLMPKDVLPATDAERRERAEQLTHELRKLALDEGHKAIIVGQLLHDVKRQELWREFAETWAEYINDLGLTASTDFQRRKNYEYYILELGMDASDHRLSEAPVSKLAVGTRDKFKHWVRENTDDFLDFARLPLGEGGLTRADLNKYLEEQVGITDENEDSTVKKALMALRRGARRYRELAEDSWTVFIEALRNDEDLYPTLAAMVEHAAKRPAAERIEVMLDDDELN